MAEQKKAVLMMHIDQEQGQLWETALSTQQLAGIFFLSLFSFVGFFSLYNGCPRMFCALF